MQRRTTFRLELLHPQTGVLIQERPAPRSHRPHRQTIRWPGKRQAPRRQSVIELNERFHHDLKATGGTDHFLNLAGAASGVFQHLFLQKTWVHARAQQAQTEVAVFKRRKILRRHHFPHPFGTDEDHCRTYCHRFQGTPSFAQDQIIPGQPVLGIPDRSSGTRAQLIEGDVQFSEERPRRLDMVVIGGIACEDGRLQGNLRKWITGEESRHVHTVMYHFDLMLPQPRFPHDPFPAKIIHRHQSRPTSQARSGIVPAPPIMDHEQSRRSGKPFPEGEGLHGVLAVQHLRLHRDGFQVVPHGDIALPERFRQPSGPGRVEATLPTPGLQSAGQIPQKNLGAGAPRESEIRE